MPYNLNHCILFSSPSVPCRKKTAAPVYCPTALSKFKSNRQTTCFKAQASRNLSTLWSKSANDSASPASGTAFRFSSTQMQTSASLSPSPCDIWPKTSGDAAPPLGSASDLPARNGREVNTTQRKWEEKEATYAEEVGKGSARCSPVKWAVYVSDLALHGHHPPLEDDRVLRRGVRCRSQGTTQDFKAEVILNPCCSARLNSASSVLSEVLTLWTLL